jgi:hypothetical protein
MMPLPSSALSVRERLLQALVARLIPVAQWQGATVHRSPTAPLTPELCPALLLFPETDGIVERSNDRATRELTVRIVALSSASPDGTPLDETSAAAEAQADRLLVGAHAALFTDVNFSGLALGLKELDVQWELDEAEVSVGAIPARYCISYRTLLHDLTQLG